MTLPFLHDAAMKSIMGFPNPCTLPNGVVVPCPCTAMPINGKGRNVNVWIHTVMGPANPFRKGDEDPVTTGGIPTGGTMSGQIAGAATFAIAKHTNVYFSKKAGITPGDGCDGNGGNEKAPTMLVT